MARMPSSAVPDDFRDLLEVDTAVLATNGADGLPQVTAVAFLHDREDDRVKISLNDSRQKTKNLRRDPRATLFLFDPANEHRTLEIRARAELLPDPDFSFAKAAGSKYGQDFHAHDQPGETRSIVVLHPLKVNPTLIG